MSLVGVSIFISNTEREFITWLLLGVFIIAMMVHYEHKLGRLFDKVGPKVPSFVFFILGVFSATYFTIGINFILGVSYFLMFTAISLIMLAMRNSYSSNGKTTA